MYTKRGGNLRGSFNWDALSPLINQNQIPFFNYEEGFWESKASSDE